MEGIGHSSPRAREDGLLVRELREGIMVYDEKRHQAHSLNQSAAFIWRHCDGNTDVTAMAFMLNQQLSLPADEELVWLALDNLEKANLLTSPLTRSPRSTAVSRRSVIRKLGLAGALIALVPVVDSLKAPAAASQKSRLNDPWQPKNYQKKKEEEEE